MTGMRKYMTAAIDPITKENNNQNRLKLNYQI